MRGTECGLLISLQLGVKYHLHSCTMYLHQVHGQYVTCSVLSKLFAGWGGITPTSLLEFSSNET